MFSGRTFLWIFLVCVCTLEAKAQYILEDFDRLSVHQVRKSQALTKKKSSTLQVFNSSVLTHRAEVLAEKLKTQFADAIAPADNTPSCEASASVPAYLKALRFKDQSDFALAFADKCLQNSNFPTEYKLATLLEASKSAVVTFQFVRAAFYYEAATHLDFSNSSLFTLAVLEYANFGLRTNFSGNVASILARQTLWNAQDVNLAYAMLEFFYSGSSKKAKKLEIRSFIEKLMVNAPRPLKSFLHTYWIRRLGDEESLIYIESNVDELLEPADWVSSAYSSFYHQSGPEEYRIAQIVYDAYVPFSTKFSWLPTETNTLNYTEILDDKCKVSVAQKSARFQLGSMKMSHLLGVDTPAISMSRVTELDKSVGPKSDILTFMGYLNTLDDKDEVAAELYFKAHKECPYYNRAHWGLSNVIRRKKIKTYKDYQDRLKNMIDTVTQLPNMDQLSSYVLNWNSLSDDTKLRLKYSLRFWARYIPFLEQNHYRIYIKRGFELMSEVPYRGHMRDLRAPYSGDNRLWDDIRGGGGNMVVVDLEEMLEEAFGVYSLASHEVTHQFHASLPEILQICIESLYEDAKKRSVFIDSYSSTNSDEYFAQAVAFYMKPSNPKWLQDNDPNLLSFLTSVSANSDVNMIQCRR